MDDDIQARVQQQFLDRLEANDWSDEDPRLQFGMAALPHFIAAIKEQRDPGRLRRLIRVVWQFRDRSALPVVAEALRDPRDEVWKDALDGIVTLGGDQALRILHDERDSLLRASEPATAIKRSWIDEAIGQVRADLAFIDSEPVWKRKRLPPLPQKSVDEHIRDRWRELGFWCSRDEPSKTWRLAASKDGLLRFRDLLLAYAEEDPGHEHLGPYFSPTLTTWEAAKIDERGIWGTLDDFVRLSELVGRLLAHMSVGSAVSVRNEFAADSGHDLVLEIQPDSFDPASADPWLPRPPPARP